VTRWFFFKINVFLFLNITFPLGHMQNVRMHLEILSQTLYCQISLQFNVSSNVSMKQGVLVRKRRSGRPSVISNDSFEDIRARLLQSPRKSLRKLSQQTLMTYGSVQRATKHLRLHPYRALLLHGLRDFWITLYKQSQTTRG
jgi:hypothetical protein